MTAARSMLALAGQAADALPTLLLEAQRVAQSIIRGTHGRRRAGMGDSFWQFRPYQQGDARRDIDWRQTAKSDHAFVREREWEAAQTAWLWRDASASMLYQSAQAPFNKKNYAELLLLALGILLLNGGEPVCHRRPMTLPFSASVRHCRRKHI